MTVKNIAAYQGLMDELRETLAPELELIESRIVQPSKELHEICKKIRKTIVKREHKLQDFDRHNNSLNKLRAKKEKSLSDEKNLFKTEEAFELASGEYEHYNNLLKTEMPAFLAMGTRFIDPLFHSFYYMQLNVYYIMLEKLQSFSDGKYDLERRDIEDLYLEQRGDAAEQLDALQITKRTQSTGELCPGSTYANVSQDAPAAPHCQRQLDPRPRRLHRVQGRPRPQDVERLVGLAHRRRRASALLGLDKRLDRVIRLGQEGAPSPAAPQAQAGSPAQAVLHGHLRLRGPGRGRPLVQCRRTHRDCRAYRLCRRLVDRQGQWAPGHLPWQLHPAGLGTVPCTWQLYSDSYTRWWIHERENGRTVLSTRLL